MCYTEFISKNKSNPKKMWEIINSAISTKSITSPLTKINIENSFIEDSSKIVDCFTNFLLKLVTLMLTTSTNPYIGYRLHYTYLRNPILHSLVLDPPTAIEIFHLINSINPNKASGAENINLFFLRIGAVVLAPILSIYFQWSFDLGIFPQAFKTAKVIPIFKFGSREILGNCRPIALLCNLSKILENLSKFDLIYLKKK